MSREAVSHLKQRRAQLMSDVSAIDAVLRQFGQSVTAPRRSSNGTGGGATKAQLAGLAKARAARAAKANGTVKATPAQRKLSKLQTRVQAKQAGQAAGQAASLADAAE